jgi:hypothetical protein
MDIANAAISSMLVKFPEVLCDEQFACCAEMSCFSTFSNRSS